MTSVQQSMFGESALSDGLTVAFAKLERSEPYTAALFEGFVSLRVLTYSASINTILKMSNKFETVECVFGYEGVLSDFSDIISFQKVTGDDLLVGIKALEDTRKQLLLEKISNNKLQMFVVKDAIAHSKIYLLDSPNKRRVIVGSANLSERAFSGKQAETVIVFDDDEAAWDLFSEEYERVKSQSSNEMSLKESLQETEIKIERVPIIERASATDTGIELFVNSDVTSISVPQVIRKVEHLAEANRKIAVSIAKPKQGKFIINRKVVGELVRLVRSQKVDEETQTPTWLSIYRETGKVILSGSEFPLDSNWESVKTDVQAIIEYFDNYNNGFYGNVLQQQKDYFAFMCWFYFSPFICELRNMAVVQQKYIFDLPYFAVIYGKSNCGKTRLIETLMRSMFGFHQFIDKGQFTRTAMRSLLNSRKRFPVVFDDVDKKQFSTHAPDIIKDEQFTLNEYPAFVLSMNAEDHTFPTELVKRCLMFFTQASLPDNDEQAKPLFNSVMAIRNRLSTSLYKEYLKRIILEIDEAGLPDDFLLFSSQILTGIMKECVGVLPNWCSTMTMAQYKDKRYSKIKEELLNLYRNNKSVWEVKRDDVVLSVASFEGAGLRKDIPDWILRPGSKGGTLILERKPLEQFLGISFRRGFIERITGRR
jgi:hypothetical protein